MDDNDSSIFINYCIHHFRVNKATIIDRELSITTFDKDSIKFNDRFL
jgi:hypothetical protein